MKHYVVYCPFISLHELLAVCLSLQIRKRVVCSVKYLRLVHEVRILERGLHYRGLDKVALRQRHFQIRNHLALVCLDLLFADRDEYYFLNYLRLADYCVPLNRIVLNCLLHFLDWYVL